VAVRKRDRGKDRERKRKKNSGERRRQRREVGERSGEIGKEGCCEGQTVHCTISLTLQPLVKMQYFPQTQENHLNSTHKSTNLFNIFQENYGSIYISYYLNIYKYIW